jgi:hypothetical protein
MTHSRIILPLIATFLLMAIPSKAGDQSVAQKSQARNLFIIVMNGVRYNDAFGDKNHLYIDNIWNKLRPLGTICTKFENRELTLPIPAQMSLLTGVWHVFKNPFSETIRPTFPTLFEYWNSARKDSGNFCYFASSRPNFEILTSSNYTGFGAKYAPVFEADKEEKVNENAIYEKALPHIMEKHPSFVYISLGAGGGTETPEKELNAICPSKGQVDACGGAAGLNAYYESIILMDQIAFDLWDRIQKVDVYKDKTVLLVLSSHGRHTDDYHVYGDKCRGCTQLYLLAIGPGIKKNFVSDKVRTLIDICKTAGALLNIPSPYAKGDVMKELFE